jgi:hypothetical protein
MEAQVTSDGEFGFWDFGKGMGKCDTLPGKR